ncbi:hypothetical protein LXA47_02110 [Massilia sp. P8910]|uniref:hypothetical protein n=1 Tax=Massilia antarctica TaxID=2765360 RepID=UPI001E492DE1|nr:hypothetical protein [Massilia antarctica]MCE3602407.1 hypothetical protein [Massilia antarctica]
MGRNSIQPLLGQDPYKAVPHLRDMLRAKMKGQGWQGAQGNTERVDLADALEPVDSRSGPSVANAAR